MTNKKTITEIETFIKTHNHFLIVQADNPDGDSLGSALALEHILGDMKKQTSMYCGVDVPEYLKFLSGWDRVSKTIPTSIDAVIIVDTSAQILLENLAAAPEYPWVASKPTLVLDHHSEVICDIPQASIILCDNTYVSTGELIYKVAQTLKWKMSVPAQEKIMQSILSDTLGLSTEATTSSTYRRMAEMLEAGVDRYALDESRKLLSKMDPSVYMYKADLIKRTEFYGDNKEVALVVIPEDELYSVGTLYNPAPLILNEMTMVEGVKMAIVIKRYKNRVTGALRATSQAPVANKIATTFGGGGHPYAAGFKMDATPSSFSDIKSDVIRKTLELIQ
jgi:phosphoesterase RecJ-like protein